MLRQAVATQAPGNELPNATFQRPALDTSDLVAGGGLPRAGKASPAARVKRWRSRSARASSPAARASNIAFSISSQYVSMLRVISQCAEMTRNCSHKLSDWRSRRNTWFFSNEHCQSACHSGYGVCNCLEFAFRQIDASQRQKCGKPGVRRRFLESC